MPEGFDAHPDARYPLVINHGHFPHTIDGFRETPPDPNVKCEYWERFHLDCYNRIQEEQAYQLYKDWTAPGFPRVLVVEIQHANPYYDDSYAVNSANLGPYGDAIVHELIPYLEKKYRGLGTGWSRFMYGGSTGGWEAMAAQVFYPDHFNGAYIACPDPIDFRAYTVVDIYKDTNAYYTEGPWARVPRPGLRNYLGHVAITLEAMNQLELVLGTKGRSGQQWDIWEAVYSPVGDGRLPEAALGQAHRRHRSPGRRVLARALRPVAHPAARLGARASASSSKGKINLYVGDMDNYYLNNAVYLVEEFLKGTKNPPTAGKWPTAIAPSTAGTATRRGPTPTRGCAITRCSSRRSPSGSARRRRPAPTSRAGATDAAGSASTLARCTR